MALTGTTLTRSTHAVPRAGAAASYAASVAHDFAEVEALWESLAAQGAALPFQRRNWLAQWYRAHDKSLFEPLLVTVMDQATGLPVMGLPLMRYNDCGLRIIAFADAGLTDYNAPVLGSHVAQDRAGALDLLRAVRAVLPPADVLYLGKLPGSVGHLANPLALLPKAHGSTLNGNILRVPGAWHDWHWGLERTFRKELERSLRVFLKAGSTSFRHVTSPAEAARIHGVLKCQQRERIRELGLPYILDEPANDRFYDGLLNAGLGDGSVVLTALMAGEEVAAALLGIRSGDHYAMVRLSTGGAKWKACSPGRLLIERTMHMLHAEGVRLFDFTIGDYPYKRRMGADAQPLSEIRLALSWRGCPVVAKERVKRFVRARPALQRVARQMRAMTSQLAALRQNRGLI